MIPTFEEFIDFYNVWVNNYNFMVIILPRNMCADIHKYIFVGDFVAQI